MDTTHSGFDATIQIRNISYRYPGALTPTLDSINLEKKLKEKTKNLLSEAKSGQGGHGASSSSQPTSQPSSPLGEGRLGGGSLGKKRKERQD